MRVFVDKRLPAFEVEWGAKRCDNISVFFLSFLFLWYLMRVQKGGPFINFEKAVNFNKSRVFFVVGNNRFCFHPFRCFGFCKQTDLGVVYVLVLFCHFLLWLSQPEPTLLVLNHEHDTQPWSASILHISGIELGLFFNTRPELLTIWLPRAIS